MVDALKHLDGVKTAQFGADKYHFILEVIETKPILPKAIEKAMPERFSFEGLSIEATGTVAKDGDSWTFTARASNQKYTLKPSDDLKKLVDSGKKLVVISGAVTEPEETDGKKPLPVIEVSGASEAKAEKSDKKDK